MRCDLILAVAESYNLHDEDVAKLIRKYGGGHISPSTIKRCRSSVGDEPWVVLGDLHIGSRSFLQSSFLSAISRIPEGEYNMLIVGDVVGGKWVFSAQEAESLISVPSWQSAAAASLIESISSRLKLKRIVIIRGNHDVIRKTGTDLALWTTSYLRDLGLQAEYSGAEWIGVIDGDPVIAVHGFGGSRFSPHSNAFLDLITRRVLELSYSTNVRPRRVIHGHTHWTSVSFPWGPIMIDSVGGWQRNDRAELLLTQRMPSILVYKDGVDVIYPDHDIYVDELADEDLYIRNMHFISELLSRVSRRLR